MSYNNFLYAIDRSDDYLAHYGVKGMRWGVQKFNRDVQNAIRSGNGRKYMKLYMKAQKKIERLQKRADKKNVYAKRAVALGAGAAATGGLALAGINPIGKVGHMAINAVVKPKFRRDYGQQFSDALTEWGNKTPLLNRANKRAAKYYVDKATYITNPKNYLPGETQAMRDAELKKVMEKADRIREAGKMTNAQMLRVGSGLTSAGLAAAAGYNAYRASTADRNARKADEWRQIVKDNFGTQGNTTRRTKKRSGR